MKQFGVQNEKISGFWLDVLIYGKIWIFMLFHKEWKR